MNNPIIKYFKSLNNNTAKSEGFTLAEVLITLGIIGVVAAMTLSALVTNIRERQTVTRLLTAQSLLTQAIRLAEEQYGGAATWASERRSSKSALEIAEKIKPFLKISVDCGLSDTNNNCVAKKFYNKNGASYHENYARSTDYYKIILINGAVVWWKSSQYGNETDVGTEIIFFIDTNGTTLPNKWGYDVFAFGYMDDTLVPWGASGTPYSYKTYCEPKNANGWGCAYWVTQNKNLDYLH